MLVSLQEASGGVNQMIDLTDVGVQAVLLPWLDDLGVCIHVYHLYASNKILVSSYGAIGATVVKMAFSCAHFSAYTGPDLPVHSFVTPHNDLSEEVAAQVRKALQEKIDKEYAELVAAGVGELDIAKKLASSIEAANAPPTHLTYTVLYGVSR